MAMTGCPLYADDQFGPQVATCQRAFDFTQLFEESILSIGLSCVLIVLAVPYLVHLRTKPRLNDLATARCKQSLATLAVLVVARFATLLASAIPPAETRTVATIPSAVLALAVASLLIIVSWHEYARLRRASLLIVAYLSVAILVTAVQTRTTWLTATRHEVAITYTCELVADIVALIAINWATPMTLSEKCSSEEIAGLYGLGLWTWLLGFLWHGYRIGLRSANDLIKIDTSFSASQTHSKLQQDHWQRTDYQHKQHAFLLAVIRTVKWALIAPIAPRVFMAAFTLAQPILLTQSIAYVQASYASDNIGYGLVGAYFFVYAGFAISSAQYWRSINRLVTHTRGTLVTAIYAKTAELPSRQDNVDSITLMSTDVERIANSIRYVHEIWATALESGIAIYLLARQTGLLALVPILVAVVCAAGSTAISNVAGARQTIWLQGIEKRLQYTFAALPFIKEVRMLGIQAKIEATIMKLRRDEVNIARWYRHIIVMSLGFAYGPTTVSPAIVFGILGSQTGVSFDPAAVFTSLALLNILAVPLITFLQSLPPLASAVANFGRIQQYLGIEPQVDFRQRPPGLARLSSTSKIPQLKHHPVLHDAIPLVPTTPPSATGRIIFDGADLGWTRDAKPVLSGINLDIASGQVVVILGTAGSGKSTLLKSMLGEALLLSGSVTTHRGSIAFADQVPWLMNASIRQNIVGPACDLTNDSYYEQVVSACAVSETWSRGAGTEPATVGSQGSKLSGGQRQRVALARAVYARSAITILDDIFSGLDIVSERNIQHALLGSQGLLRRSKSTVIIATHSLGCIAYADHVVVLSSSGVISAMGTPEQVAALENEHGVMLKSVLESRAQTSVETDDTATAAADGERNQRQVLDVIQTYTAPPAQVQHSTAYRLYFASLGKVNVASFLCCAVAFTIALRFPDLWLTWWTDADPQARSSGEVKYVGTYIALQVSTLGLVILWAWLYLNKAIAHSGIELHRLLLRTTLHARMSFFDKVDRSITANRFSQDLQLVDSELPGALLNATAEILGMLGQLVLIGIGFPLLCASFPVLFVALYVVQKFYLSTSRSLRLHDIEAKSPLYKQFLETLEGIVTIRAFGWHSALQHESARLLDQSQRPFYLLLSIQQWLNLVLDLFVAALAVILVGVVTPLRGTVSASYLGLALSNMVTLGENLRNLIMWITKLETSIGVVHRIDDFITTTKQESDAATSTPPVSWPEKGRIDFECVDVRYEEADLDRAPALGGLDLHIAPGSKIGICGESGSGKSTLLSTLFGLIDTTAGRIMIDGIDISTIPRDVLRRSITGLPQTPFLVTGTYRDNLDLNGDSSDDLLWAALDKVKLTNVIKAHGGLDAAITEHALSQGQRQLFSACRALLKNSKVLILDEPSSSIDAQNDQLLQDVIHEHFRDCTVLVVAHRLRWIADADTVLVLSQGKVAEQGSPSELLKLQDGLFTRMWQTQY